MRAFVTACLICLLVALVGVVHGAARAQTWAPERLPGSARLELSDLRYWVLPENLPPEVAAAIDDFNKIFAQRYGRELLPPVGGKFSPKRALVLESLAAGRPGGGFTIRRQGSRVVISAVDPDGWANGLYAILHKMMGARWYWEGSLGFETVAPDWRFFPERAWRVEPAFIERNLHPVDRDFGRRNRLNRIYSYNHSLGKVFDAEVFAATPEVFSEVNGRRKPPTGSGGTDPQPDFTHPGAVEHAARAALDHFSAHPASRSFSLSLNDNVLFDTRESTKAAVYPLRYFRGRPNYSDLVFHFMNQVAERVFDEGGAWQTPSGDARYLTALAYYWTEPAPGFALHPRVMPVLTSDRAQWHDPAYRAQDKSLIRSWSASGAERIGTWDYYFGAPYLYPRQFNQWIEESLAFMADAGVEVFFSQLPSFWGLDGGKAWLAARLLWDPRQDADALLDEFYQNFFGPAAGPMRAFYEKAETYRNEYEGRAEWIKFYKDEAGIALFSDEMLRELRECIEAARGLVPLQSRWAQRVDVVSQAFALTEVYAYYNQTRQSLVEALLDQTAPADLASGLADFRQAREAYGRYLQSYLKTEYAPLPHRVLRAQSDPEAIALHALEADAGGRFVSLSGDPHLIHRGYYERNFLGPVLPWLSGWYLDYRPSEAFQVLPSAGGPLGSGLRVSGADILSIFRTFPVDPLAAYELRLRGTWRISPDNRVQVNAEWLGRGGKILESLIPVRLPAGEREEPGDLRIPFDPPEGASALRVRVMISRQYPGDFFDVSLLDLGRIEPMDGRAP